MDAAVRTAPRKSARQRRAVATVEAILDAAAQVLIAQGYEGATTNRIAQRAGVSIGSLYQYYPNKEAVVAALIERHHAQCLEVFIRHISEAVEAPLRVGIRRVIEGMVAAYRVSPRLHRVLIAQVPKVDRIWSQHKLEDDAANILRPFLEERRAELRVRNLEVAVPLLVSTVEAAIHLALGPRPKLLESGDFIDELAVLVERYLLPDGPGAATGR